MLTARQQEIWNFLVEYVDRHGYPPTVREIGERVGLASPSTVHAHLANLERAGLLRRDPTKPRALELIGREKRDAEPAAEDARDVARLPLVGQIAAGGPLLAEQNVEEYVPLPAATKGDFLLRVKGESMIDAGSGTYSSTFCSASSGPPAAISPMSGSRATSRWSPAASTTSASRRSRPISSRARGFVGSRRSRPARSRFARCACTVDGDASPTRSPISRTVGG